MAGFEETIHILNEAAAKRERAWKALDQGFESLETRFTDADVRADERHDEVNGKLDKVIDLENKLLAMEEERTKADHEPPLYGADVPDTVPKPPGVPLDRSDLIVKIKSELDLNKTGSSAAAKHKSSIHGMGGVGEETRRVHPLVTLCPPLHNH